MSQPAVDESACILKVRRRIIPYLFICYVVNYLDRFNVSYAALEMKGDLGFTDAAYGLGAGMFFFGYVLFEIPSNLIMERVGSRVWIARIMITWGIISSCMMLVKTATAFYLLRFLLGLAEAGFFPGMVVYLTYWIPARERAKNFALFLTSTSLAGVFGGPISGALLKLGGIYGLKGWQWLFLLEGIPAIVLGITTLAYLSDKPEQATWLSPAERRWLTQTLAEEHELKRRTHGLTLVQALVHPRVWRLCWLYLFIVSGFYGVAFWLPQILQSLSGYGNSTVAIISALPYLAASVAMVLIASNSDRTRERRWHVALSAFSGSVGLALSAYFYEQNYPLAAFLALCLAASGIWGALGPFWSLPTMFLSGTAAVAGVALINSIGNIGGFIGPYATGYAKELTGSFTSGLMLLALALLIASFMALGSDASVSGSQ